MKKIAMFLLITAMLFSSCDNKNYQVGCNDCTKARFETIYNDFEHSLIILYDTETLVEYSVSNGGYNAGTITMLVDSLGNPLLYRDKK